MALNKKLKEARDFFHAADYHRAKNIYQKIINDFPDAIHRQDILYNLGLTLIALEEFDQAESMLEKVLALQPNHADALNNLGALLLKKNNYSQAMQCFSAVLNCDPAHLEARNNLAACLLHTSQYVDAVEQYQLLLEALPKDLDAQYNYGVALLESFQYEKAINVFEKILNQVPHHLNVEINLGIAYLKWGHLEAAQRIFKIILEKNPDNSEIDYLYRAISQENIPHRPPLKYIERLFDQYAHYYDNHMISMLQFKIPELLWQLFKKYISIEKKLKVLEVGCGTGLSGIIFYSISESLTGIDISSKMLEIAKNKNIYNTLIHSDLVEYIQNTGEKYDLIIASDTLNYFGELDAIFKHIYLLLNERPGLFLFSLEAEDSNKASERNAQRKDFYLHPHGRYTHVLTYIEDLIVKNGFNIIEIQNTILREQNHQPVKGFVCLISRSKNDVSL